jgi:hypothetical protein
MPTEIDDYNLVMHRLYCIEEDAKKIRDAVRSGGLKYVKGNIPILQKSIDILGEVGKRYKSE